MKKPRLSSEITTRLLAWHAPDDRPMPWRTPVGKRRNPYHVWLSEVMLQQTTVAAVIPYFERFVRAFPTVQDLADADDDQVMKMWAGLGYYARARNLLKCARIVTREHNGRFPATYDGLLALPGVGDYTAAAIAAIAFDGMEPVVDGNVERVVARLGTICTHKPQLKSDVKDVLRHIVPKDKPGAFAEAMMDLGATICTPKNPACDVCPVVTLCMARREGRVADLPVRSPKTQKPTRCGTQYWIEDASGHVLLVRRPERGLLGGMLGFPGTDWAVGANIPDERAAPVGAKWRVVDGVVQHTFTHFHLQLTVLVTRVEGRPDDALGTWVHRDALLDHGLPTVMRKVAEVVLAEEA